MSQSQNLVSFKDLESRFFEIFSQVLSAYLFKSNDRVIDRGYIKENRLK